MSTLKTLTARDVRTCAAEIFRPEHSALVVVGDVDEEEVRLALPVSFGDWHPPTVPRAATLPVARLGSKSFRSEKRVHIALQADDGAAQVFLLQPAPVGASLEEDVAFALLTRIVASSLASRAMRQLRHDQTLTYGVRLERYGSSELELFAVSTTVDEREVVAAVESLIDILTSLQDEAVPAEELEPFKLSMLAEAEMTDGNNHALARALASAFAQGRSAEWRDEVRGAILASTPEDLQTAAKKFLRPEAPYIGVAGPSWIESGLRRYGEVSFFRLVLD